MVDISKGFVEFWKHWYGKVLLTIVCFFLIGFAFWGISKNSDIDLWGFKISQSKTIVIHDTVKNFIPKPSIKDTTRHIAITNRRKNSFFERLAKGQISTGLHRDQKTSAKSDTDTLKAQGQQSQFLAKNYAGVNIGGQVGDNYIGTVPEFSETNGNEFIETLEKYRRDSSIVSKSIVINNFLNSDQNRFGAELFGWLSRKGYRVSIRANRLMKIPFVGLIIHYEKQEQCFEVKIGNYK